MSKLNIKYYYKGVKDKFVFMDYFCNILKISRNNIVYVGDDINDLVNMLSVNWSFCFVNGVNVVRENCDFVLYNIGGDMVIWEVIEIIGKLNKRI